MESTIRRRAGKVIHSKPHQMDSKISSLLYKRKIVKSNRELTERIAYDEPQLKKDDSLHNNQRSTVDIRNIKSREGGILSHIAKNITRLRGKDLQVYRKTRNIANLKSKSHSIFYL